MQRQNQAGKYQNSSEKRAIGGRRVSAHPNIQTIYFDQLLEANAHDPANIKETSCPTHQDLGMNALPRNEKSGGKLAAQVSSSSKKRRSSMGAIGNRTKHVMRNKPIFAQNQKQQKFRAMTQNLFENVVQNIYWDRTNDIADEAESPAIINEEELEFEGDDSGCLSRSQSDYNPVVNQVNPNVKNHPPDKVPVPDAASIAENRPVMVDSDEDLPQPENQELVVTRRNSAKSKLLDRLPKADGHPLGNTGQSRGQFEQSPVRTHAVPNGHKYISHSESKTVKGNSKN